MKKFFKILGLIVSGIISVVVILLCVVVLLFSKKAQVLLPTILGTETAQSENVNKKILKNGTKLADQIQAEGTVLLKNDKQMLPLNKDVKKVNVFGWAGTEWLSGGSGSGTVREQKTNLLQALKNYGISYNEELADMYQDFHGVRPYQTLHALNSESYRLYEPSLKDKDYYSDQLLDDAKKYSDTAFFVVGRLVGESSDSPRKQYKVMKKADKEEDIKVVEDDSRSYLDLSTEEEELLTYLGQNYKHVVVIVNSGTSMLLGKLETIPGVDAAILVGNTGTDAATAIPKVLYGEVSPSGRTTDTYAYQLDTNASYANSGADGVGKYTNAKGLYPNDGKTINSNTGRNDTLYDQVSYLDYTEGIYVGYRWYETADAEGFWNRVDNEYGKGYEGVVQYPFGYGMSYTTFDWDVLEIATDQKETMTPDGKITAKVKVTNTGKYPGKDVVQMYYTPPYQKGGIEKSAVNLAAFAKTKELAPGESQVVDLQYDIRDMASYDDKDKNHNQFKGYELDPGNYEVKIMKNAHDLGNQKNAVKAFELAEGIRYPKDKNSGKEIKNIFTDQDPVDGVALDGSDSDANLPYLTRADFEGTFPKENIKERPMTENIKKKNLYTKKEAENWNKEKADPVTFGKKNNLKVYQDNHVTKLGLALGKNYDDPKWNDVLDQMTKDEMENLVLHGYVHTEAVSSIGKPVRVDLDGPSQVNSYNYGAAGTGFSNGTLIAQTWNKELLNKMGMQVAKEAASIGVSGWYAPGVNIHRSPFGGRNYEYYSEDALLSGQLASEVIQGAKNGGTYTYLKHLALYEQDTNRDSMYTWVSEQALREVYLKPFQYAIENGGATGMMSSYNRIGAVWAGGSQALLQNLLRDEWGFKGTVITDYSDHHEFMNVDQMIRGGGDLFMDGATSDGQFMYPTDSARFDQALRRSSKNILYTWLNALAENEEYNKTADQPIVQPQIKPKFAIWNVIAIIVLLVVIALWVFYIVRKIKKKKAKGTE